MIDSAFTPFGWLSLYVNRISSEEPNHFGPDTIDPIMSDPRWVPGVTPIMLLYASYGLNVGPDFIREGAETLARHRPAWVAVMIFDESSHQIMQTFCAMLRLHGVPAAVFKRLQAFYDWIAERGSRVPPLP